MPSRFVPTPLPIDLGLTLGPLLRGADPTMRIVGVEVWRASRTPEGPVTVRFAQADGGIDVETWGPGSPWLLERSPEWCGALDDDSSFEPPQVSFEICGDAVPGSASRAPDSSPSA